MEPLEVIHEEPEATDMPIESGTKQGRVSLARVVEALGNLNGVPRMSSKKSTAAGGALREIYGSSLTPAAAANIANHMRYSARCDPLLTLHHMQANLEAALPELVPTVPIGARPTKGGAAPKTRKAPAKKRQTCKGGGHDTGYGGAGYGGDADLGGNCLV